VLAGIEQLLQCVGNIGNGMEPAKKSYVAKFVRKCVMWEEEHSKKLPSYADIISVLLHPTLEWIAATTE
jgi:hypothetical protein